MKILICGAGEVGKAIAKYLALQDDDITLIDEDEKAFGGIRDAADIRTVTGSANHPSVLEEARAADADIIIAVTGIDETNIMICEIAHVMFKVPVKICRIRTKEYMDPRIIEFYKSVKVIDHIISPELQIARAIMRNIAVPGTFETVPVAEGKLTVLGIKCQEGSPVVHTKIKQILELFPTLQMTITGIVRGVRTIPVNPDQYIEAGDSVYAVVKTADIPRALNAFGIDEKETGRIAIFGGGKIAEILAGMIVESQNVNDVKLIEKDHERATELAVAFEDKNIEVISGDILNPDLLDEIGIKNMDMSISITNEDENNILSALLAKKICRNDIQTVSVINKQIYSSLVSNLGVDVIIDPNAITVSTILQHVRRGSVSSAYSLSSEFFELLEIEVLETSKIAGQSLADLKFPKSTVIGAVLRDGESIDIKRDMTMENGDVLIVFISSTDIKSLEKMIAVSIEYF